jgi:hypothetical protein
MKDIERHIINALIAGLIAFLSGLAAVEQITPRVITTSIIAMGLVMCYKLKDYFDTAHTKAHKRHNSLINFL